MPTSSRLQFNVRRGTRLGDKLILRYAANSAAVARQLRDGSGQQEIPGQLTVGYYFMRGESGMWAFAPAPTRLATAALDVEAVRDRICEDLAIYARKAPK